jgi:DNA primase
MARIPEGFVDQLLSRIDIVELINRRIPLKRAGREFQACCPFHDERTASFTVSPQKQFYHCFGCGAHGSALGFVMNYDNLEFTDAIESLAGELGVEVPYEGSGFRRNDGSDALFPILADATQFFVRHLHTHDEAKAYLHKRGLDRATIDRFQIGFAPADGNLIVQALGTTPERRKALVESGLTTAGARGDYGKFRERVMFPILDKRGRTIAFGGRIIGPGEPKYLNSPETALFKKSQELYGLYFARQQKLKQLIVVEGYMDVVSLAQHGVTEAVATLGTATSREHSELLFRNVDEVIFCFDGDRAGRQAAWRALGNVLPRMRDGRQALFLFLPDGEDPDSLVRKEGADALRARYAQALPTSRYFFDELSKECDLSSIEGRARLSERAKPMLQTIPDGAFAELMQAELARITGLSAARTEAPRNNRTAAVTRRLISEGDMDGKLKVAVSRLLSEPALATLSQPPYAFASLDAPGIELLLALLELARERPDANGTALVAYFDGHPWHAQLMALLAEPSLGEDAVRKIEYTDALQHLSERSLEQRKKLLTQRFIDGTLNADEKAELLELQKMKAPRASF